MGNGLQRVRQAFPLGGGRQGLLYSLPELEAAGYGQVSRLPVSLRIVLESMLRHLDGQRVTEAQVRALARWAPRAPRTEEIPFVVARILLQDFTGVPLLCDLAAMRDAAQRLGHDPGLVEPVVPVDLVVDHSVQVDHFREANALDLNMRLEFQRNAERYRFIKWGMQAFDDFRVVPPGIGIVHQVNLEHLARGVHQRDGVYFPDSLVGTDSHTTMINGLGVLAWGVGGIEAEAGMLGLPVTFLTPDVVGVHLAGRLRPGVTATDLVLVVTEQLRRARVVGQFVEFFGEGAASLTLPDRATLANMAPEYGATMGYFPPDEVAASYLAATGRTDEEVDAFRRYFQAQQMFGMPRPGDIDYSRVIELDLDSVVPCVAGPKRPQDRVPLPELKARFGDLLHRPVSDGGYGLADAASLAPRPAPHPQSPDGLRHGSVLIAAITSCTNTSNPGVMLAAGLLARRAVERGLSVAPHIKTSLAPGSRVVTDYLAQAGLLAQLGFRVVAYGCTTCIGNAGPLEAPIEEALRAGQLVCAAVLSGNRNFEARIHPSLKANFLMSPPLVVAFALAGRVDIDLDHEPIGHDAQGAPVFLRELMLPPGADGRPVEGSLTLMPPAGTVGTIYDTAMQHQAAGTPTLIFAGQEYGTGSSRDWAAKGTRLLGVRAVVARSFERIHRSNLVGMGVLPLQFMGDDSAESLGLCGDERFDLPGVEDGVTPGQVMRLRITHVDGRTTECTLRLRIDTPVEADYFRHGGIQPYVLRDLLARAAVQPAPSI